MPTKIEKDEISGQVTTGHEWDGVKELNTPLPRWWLWIFYATIIYALVYWVIYPAFPVPRQISSTGYSTGVLNYSSRGEVNRDLTALAKVRAITGERLAAAPLADILSSADLREVALAAGRAAFGNNCAPCHGSNAAGRPGYPNLNSDNWIWGGTLDDIHQTITHGVRWDADPETRNSMMPGFGADGILTSAQISDVAEHVRNLKEMSDVDQAAAARGEAIFTENCASCHGGSGEGNRDFGAPALTGPSRLYGSAKADIMAQVTKPRHGVMPAWGARLDPITIKALTVYVHTLGGGK
jgi:cytochrome c oxidase cbb3-type subunit 3